VWIIKRGKTVREYVFKLEQKHAYPNIDISEFVMIDSFSKTFQHIAIMTAHLGVIKTLAQLIKSLFPSRNFYFLKQDGVIINCGQLTTGFCRYYDVKSTDVVIGSLWTDPKCRGQGLAARGMQAAINCMIANGCSNFFINTQENNLGMLKAIEKIGFQRLINFSEN
jgi:predicted GNAT family N-acyltransferase